jgi:hypothetical protein
MATLPAWTVLSAIVAVALGGVDRRLIIAGRHVKQVMETVVVTIHQAQARQNQAAQHLLQLHLRQAAVFSNV